MIINRNESEVTVLGDVQKYKVSIDANNINHIVTILSSNLYSYPMESFLREIVSNAVDSHIEAGSLEPIILTVTDKDISIRDYGTGISPERFQDIYLNIGSSTKRDTNQYIGSFGIGRFAPLAVADVVNVTSFYNGRAYYYVMNKDVDQLHIDLMYEKNTEEHNGVEVKVPVRNWDADSLACLTFIDNLYVECKTHEDYIVEKFNKRKISVCKNFKLTDTDLRPLRNKCQILLGKIPYNVDYRSLWDYSDYAHLNWEKTFQFVFPMIDIGELDITPNREGLLYSDRTKKVLREKYDACIEELKEMWDKQCSTEFDNIQKYLFSITQNQHNYLLFEDYTIPMSDDLVLTFKYKGFPEWENIPQENRVSICKELLSNELTLLGRMEGGTLYQGDRKLKYYTVRHLLRDMVDNSLTRQIIALPDKTGFSGSCFKDYLDTVYNAPIKILLKSLPSHYTVAGVKATLRRIFLREYLSSSDTRVFIYQLIRELVAYVRANIEIKDIVRSPEYIEFRKKNTVRRAVVHSEKVAFIIDIPQDNITYSKTVTVPDVMEFIQDWPHFRVVYAERDNPFISVFMYMKYPRLVILSVAPGKRSYIAERLPKWVKPIENLYSPENRTLQKFATMRYICNIPEVDNDFLIKRYMPESIYSTLQELVGMKQTYGRRSREADAILDIVPPEKYDRKMLGLFREVEKWQRISYKMDKIKECNYRLTGDLLYYFLMKNKKFRINYTLYRRIREMINNSIEII